MHGLWQGDACETWCTGRCHQRQSARSFATPIEEMHAGDGTSVIVTAVKTYED